MSEQVVCKDNCVVTAAGNMVHVSNGNCYVLNGEFLSGPGVNNMRMNSLSEALGYVVGLHGGRQF